MSANLFEKPDNLLHSVFLSLLIYLTVGIPSPATAQLEKNERYAALCDSGFAALDREEIENAYVLFRQALRIKGSSSSALLGLGRVMLKNPAGGMRAVDYLSKAVQLDPDNPEIHYYKALAHLRMSNISRGINHQSRIAFEELEKVIELDPEHHDAYYQRGLIIRYRHHDFERALESFRKQIDVNPDHEHAQDALPEENVGLSIRDLGFRSWDDAVEAAGDIVTRDPGQWGLYPYLSAAYWNKNQPEEAMKIFDSYFTFLSKKEQDLYLDLTTVLSPNDQNVFLALDERGRETYSDYYWRTRDPIPNTIVNERLLEHFLRVAYSRSEFGRQGNQWPWDIRGDFYVRYGKPDFRALPNNPYPAMLLENDIEFFIMKRNLERKLGISPYPPDYDISLLNEQLFGINVPTIMSVPNERWFYFDIGLAMAFRNPMQDGFILLSANNQLLDAMSRYLPVVSDIENIVETFEPLQLMSTFRGDVGKTTVVYSLGLLSEDIPGLGNHPSDYSSLITDVEILSEDWHLIESERILAQNLSLNLQTNLLDTHLFIDGTVFEVRPGNYQFSVFCSDPKRNVQSNKSEQVVIPDYSGSNLMISDLLPIVSISEENPDRNAIFIRDDMEILPFPGRVLEFDRPLLIYYEIYNLTKDEFGATDYRIDYSISIAPYGNEQYSKLYQGIRREADTIEMRPLVTSSFTRSGINSDISSSLDIDMSAFVANIDRLEIYEVQLSVVDNHSVTTATSSLLFRVLPDWHEMK